jgi:hypothetical protein
MAASAIPTHNFVILPGQEAHFQSFAEGLRQQFQPEGGLQDFLFHQILHASWNLHRCHHAEASIFGLDPTTDPILAETNEAKLKLIAFYANRAERSYSRFVNELRRVQTEALYRLAMRNDESFSPLAESKAVDKQIAADNLRRQQAILTEVRALCEEPMPAPPSAPPPPPPRAPEQTKPRQAQGPAPTPSPAPEQTKPSQPPTPQSPASISDPTGRLRLGFSRAAIFRRNKNKNRNQQAA